MTRTPGQPGPAAPRVEASLLRETADNSNPASTVWADCNGLRYWTDSKAGTYELRFLDKTVLLAEGTFKLK